jgi:D-alanyl-D-alanine dipeptidase
LLLPTACAGAESDMPSRFVYLRDVDPTVRQDMRYAGAHNFTGHPVPGYAAAECVLVREAAAALKAVQAELRAKHLALKVYDCYRPARAVAAFVAWAKEPDDPQAKAIYYPALAKQALFPGYIATQSGHSRGATMDLTLVPLEAPAPARGAAAGCAAAPANTDGSLDMGTRLLRPQGQYRRPWHHGGGAQEPRPAARRDGAARLQELRQRVVALHARERALPRHDLRFPDSAAS